MSYTGSVTRKIVAGGQENSQTENFDAGMALRISESIPDGTTDQLITCAIDVSNLKWLYIHSDKALTIETNATDHAGGEQLVLAANKPYLWCYGDYSACAFTVDITKLYITNSSGGAAALLIEAGIDPTT